LGGKGGRRKEGTRGNITYGKAREEERGNGGERTKEEIKESAEGEVSRNAGPEGMNEGLKERKERRRGRRKRKKERYDKKEGRNGRKQ
jgi:hypothetical protein